MCSGYLNRDHSGRRKALLLSAVLPVLGASLALAIVDVQVDESAEVLYRNAQFGDPAAQFKLAECYEEGRKLTQSSADAMKWYRKAAAAGYSRAEARLGARLYDGKGVAQNEKEAMQWLHTAARNGMIEAQMMMVDAYVTGRGVEKNLATALTWDLVARRTMELHYGVPAGLPAMRDEKENVKSNTKWADLRYIENSNGLMTAVYRDGSWETVYPFGAFTQEVTAEGRRILRDSQGNSETTEPDGSKVGEETRTNSKGAKIRIQNIFDSEGKRTNHRVIDGDSVYEERADGTRTIETRLKRDDGVEVILTEQVAANGSQGKGKLRRAADGAGPNGGELWTVRRTLHPAGGGTAEVIEKYSQEGLRSQQILRQMKAEPTPVSTPAVSTTAAPFGKSAFEQAPQPQTTSLPELPAAPGSKSTPSPVPSYDDPTAFAKSANVEPLLRMLAKIESRA